jgi:hypothetical protein
MPGKEIISQQDTNFCELFSFLNWQGIGLVRYLYWIGSWAIGFLNLGFLISGLASGHPGWIVAVLVVVPLLALFEIVLLRICCEVIVVILLLPHILRKSNFGSSEHDVTVIEDPNDDGDMDCSVHRDLI